MITFISRKLWGVGSNFHIKYKYFLQFPQKPLLEFSTPCYINFLKIFYNKLLPPLFKHGSIISDKTPVKIIIRASIVCILFFWIMRTILIIVRHFVDIIRACYIWFCRKFSSISKLTHCQNIWRDYPLKGISIKLEKPMIELMGIKIYK